MAGDIKFRRMYGATGIAWWMFASPRQSDSAGTQASLSSLTHSTSSTPRTIRIISALSAMPPASFVQTSARQAAPLQRDSFRSERGSSSRDSAPHDFVMGYGAGNVQTTARRLCRNASPARSSPFGLIAQAFPIFDPFGALSDRNAPPCQRNAFDFKLFVGPSVKPAVVPSSATASA